MTILTGTLADFTAIGPLPAVGGYLRLRLDSFDAEHTTREWITPIVSGQFATELPDLPVNGSVYLRAEGVPGFPNVHIANYAALATVTLLDLLAAQTDSYDYRGGVVRWNGEVIVQRSPGRNLIVSGSWATNEAWPTSLPGSAHGIIMNL